MTRVEPWLVSKLTAAFSGAYEGKTKLEMPQFQRGVVWSPAKQAELVRSLKQGYPIGSLLFYRRPEKQGVLEVNLLIDGLQRTTAIRDYKECPLSFMELADVDTAALEALEAAFRCEVDGLGSSAGFRSAIERWMSQTATLDPKDGFDAWGFLQFLNADLFATHPVALSDPLVAAIRTFLESIKSECDIDSIEVPVLFYDGSEADLPDIFERINATGTKLSKYEVFAASWVSQDVDIKNETVLEAVRKRYYALMNVQNISVNGVKADGTPEHMSLFDYLFGLGKVLSDDFPLLFGVEDDPMSMESVGFALATVCHRLPISQMSRLPKAMDCDENEKIATEQFESALLESAQFVADTLAPFIGIKLNSESASSAVAHTAFQIASMVARAFSGKYVPGTWETRDGADADRAALKERLPEYYLVDVLQQNWRGAGDSRLFQMVWEVEEDAGAKTLTFSPGRYYLRDIDPDEFDRVLEQFFSDQVRLNQRSRSYVTAPARAFLKFVYADVVTIKAENKETFELDHVFPVSRLVGLAKEDQDGWPISAVANLALFDWQTNREKSKLDLGQYLEKVDPADRSKKRETIEKYLFLPVETAAIPRDEAKADIITREDYLGFLRQRFERMKSLAFAAVDIPLPKQAASEVPHPEVTN